MYDIVEGDDEVVGADYDFLLGDDYSLGSDMVLGDDDLSIGGPRRRRGRRVRAKRIQPSSQTQVLNFPRGAAGAVTVAAAATAVLTARPQRPFQTERFVVSSAISAFFAISDLVIGRDSMFVNSEFAAAEVFSQTGVGVSLMGFIARPGIDITVTVLNLDAGAAHPFFGSIIGPTLA